MVYLFWEYSKMEYKPEAAVERREYTGMKVLVVDDERVVRETLLYIFQKHGFSVETAVDGREALEKAGRCAPDIIILDFAMPERDGVETCMRLRNDPRTREIPVIFFSTRPPPEEDIRRIPGQPVRYVEKPCDLEKLFAQIDGCVPRRSSPP